jgi:hypothetical protein
MKRSPLLSFLLLFLITVSAAAQDTLPKFSLINAGNNRIIIGWVNTLPNVKQISIQRSYDSLTGYISILTVADPTTVQNGYLDAKAPNDRMFYRLYIMQDKGNYIFSKAKRPSRDSGQRISAKDPVIKDNIRSDFSVEIKRKPDNIVTMDGRPLIPDSLRVKPVVLKLNGLPATIDTVLSPTGVQVKKKTDSFVPSLYVFTCSDGYICIRLPEAEKPKKYSIKFFDQKELLLFELKEPKEREFKLDKANFYHAGWFRFEIYEDGRLFEKHKFYLEKEF